MGYRAPLRDMRFVLREVAGLDAVARLPGCEEATPETVDAVLEQAARFAAEVLDPLNATGDREGARWEQGAVRTPSGFREAYRQFVANGWASLPISTAWGGQGLPRLVATPVEEMWCSANMSFSLCPMLTQGAIHALEARASEALKRLYLPKMASGEWTGTMNLTEPQAGSDLALLRTRAEAEAGGRYRIHGQKIFITYGEHDWTDQIVHLVLARTPDAPEGVKGISLFVVPKRLVGPDGELGERNGVHCTSIEHKLGIHASPTAVMSYDGARGWLVGEENRGLEIMFLMMNAARFAVGLEGVAIAERATQRALAYARERLQGRELAGAGGPPVPIVRHPDVRRMLMLMKAQTEAMRALAYAVAARMDAAQRHPVDSERQRAQALVDLLIPVVKGWFTETGFEIASLGVQVHGGMGYIEETGAAQHLRDARIATIYEGTTGIQANDLIGRKILREGGSTAQALLDEMRSCAAQLAADGEPALASVGAQLTAAVSAASDALRFVLERAGSAPREVYAGAVPFLRLMGIVCGGWQMGRAALAARRRLGEAGADRPFLEAKVRTARFYAEHLLPQAAALRTAIVTGGASVLALEEEQFYLD